MTYTWWFVATAVGAAAAFATSTRLKHLSAHNVPDGQSLNPAALGRFVRATVVHRLWLCGIAADCAGLGLQMLALHLGPLTAVQPLLILSLPMALVLWPTSPDRRRGIDLGWIALLVAGLGFVVTLAATGDTPKATAPVPLAVAAGGIGLLATVTCIAVGRTRRRSGRSAAAFGIAVGIIYASTAALLKAITGILAHHPISLLWSWQLYAVVALGAAGLVLNQVAFQAGPLRASLPAISVVDPLVSIAVGMWVFGEHMRLDALTTPLLAVAVVMMAVAVIRLAPSAAGAGSNEQNAARTPAAEPIGP